MDSKFIKVNNITYGYNKKKNVFTDFSLDINKGNIVGLLGKNGTGKSTLLYLLSGLLFPQKGEVLYKGNDVRQRKVETLQDIFIVPEEFALPATSLNKYIKMNAPFYPNFSNEIMKKAMENFELDMNLDLKSLSMGTKKKVFMSFALATNTSLLLMDEPTNGLDIPSKSQFRKVIASGMSDDKTVIISTHQAKDIDSILDHILIVDESDILLNQSVADITEKLLFTDGGLNEDYEDAIFTQPSIHGKSAIFKNLEGEDSQINLELLFNAVEQNREAFKEIFNK